MLKRTHRKIERTPEQLAELQAVREKFQREKPTLDDLAKSGGVVLSRHKGYTGTMKLDVESGVIHGQVDLSRDVVTFQGETVEDANQAFRDSVDDYLEHCAESGKDAEKPDQDRVVNPPE